MIPTLLIRYGLAAIVAASVLGGFHHHGVVSGRAERDAYWTPAFAAAEKAANEAKINAPVNDDRIVLLSPPIFYLDL